MPLLGFWAFFLVIFLIEKEMEWVSDRSDLSPNWQQKIPALFHATERAGGPYLEIGRIKKRGRVDFVVFGPFRAHEIQRVEPPRNKGQVSEKKILFLKWERGRAPNRMIKLFWAPLWIHKRGPVWGGHFPFKNAQTFSYGHSQNLNPPLVFGFAPFNRRHFGAY
ncbi:MAG: hypothetical protein CM15mP46_4530 [Alphaproteobacteria bacterium]|nr:MAG: hypothetical protein CM15mP46_4530 [Alphaproteobacteria bacterium]